MWTRLQIASMVFMMVQAVLFGIGMVFVLVTPLTKSVMTLVPWMIAGSFIVSAPLAWLIAPRLQLRYWRQRHTDSDIISGQLDFGARECPASGTAQGAAGEILGAARSDEHGTAND